MKNLVSSFFVGMTLVLLFLIVPAASAVTVTASPDHVQKGDRIIIAIRNLNDGSSFSYSIEGQYGTLPGTDPTFRMSNFTLPFRLHTGTLSATMQGVEWAQLSVKRDLTTVTICQDADEDGYFTVSQGYDATSGTYTFLKLRGETRPDASRISAKMGLAGTKEGPDNSRITFTLDEIDDGEVTLIVVTDGKEALHKTIKVGNGIIPPPPPVAGFTGTPRSGTAPLTVRFTDTSSHFPISWKWSFGDGSRVNGSRQNPVHTYTKPGIYRVALNATNAGGSNTSTKVSYIRVSPPAPVANFAAMQLSGTPPLTVTFMDRTTNSPTTWRWIFGDGSPVNATRQNPVHTNTDLGTYNVSLKATNTGGSDTIIKRGYIVVLTPHPTLTPNQ